MTLRPFFLLVLAAGLAGQPVAGSAQMNGMVRRAQPAEAQPPAAEPAGGQFNNGVPLAPMAVDPNRRLKQGDQLLIRIEQDNEPATPLIVSSSGEVVVEPLEEAVRVVDMTVNQAQGEIKRRLEKDYYYQATVRLTLTQANTQAGIGTVYLTGCVQRVGEMAFSSERPMSLSQAITKAGGFTRYANQRKVQVTRQRKGAAPIVFEVDLKEIMIKGRTEGDKQLQDQDSIYVPQTWGQF